MNTEKQVRTAISIAYDGTGYCGWQKQKNDSTVQGNIEEKLETLFRAPTTIHGSGRTDSGVHAVSQVAHFARPESFTCSELHTSLNSLLPPDIRITAISDVNDEFHAQYSALSKTYVYCINMNRPASPFSLRYSTDISYKLDLEKMKTALGLFEGEHDFYYFTTPVAVKKSSLRNILKAELFETYGYLFIKITGSGFLRYMVRAIAGTLIKIANGKVPLENLDKLFIKEPVEPLPITLKAPANGLYLLKVDYEETLFDEFEYTLERFFPFNFKGLHEWLLSE